MDKAAGGGATGMPAVYLLYIGRNTRQKINRFGVFAGSTESRKALQSLGLHQVYPPSLPAWKEGLGRRAAKADPGCLRGKSEESQ